MRLKTHTANDLGLMSIQNCFSFSSHCILYDSVCQALSACTSCSVLAMYGDPRGGPLDASAAAYAVSLPPAQLTSSVASFLGLK